MSKRYQEAESPAFKTLGNNRKYDNTQSLLSTGDTKRSSSLTPAAKSAKGDYIPHFGNFRIHGNQNVYNRMNSYQNEGVDLSLYHRGYSTQNKFYSNREQRAFRFFQEDNVTPALVQIQTAQVHSPSKFKGEYETMKTVTLPDFSNNRLPTSTELVKQRPPHKANTASRLGSSQFGLRKIKTQSSNTPGSFVSSWGERSRQYDPVTEYNAILPPAGYGNYGPQRDPQNIPQQKHIYFYKR